MSIENHVAQIHEKNEQVDAYNVEIKSLYETLAAQLQASGNVRTSEVDDTYKAIERTFGRKSTLEIEVRKLTNELMTIVLE